MGGDSSGKNFFKGAITPQALITFSLAKSAVQGDFTPALEYLIPGVSKINDVPKFVNGDAQTKSEILVGRGLEVSAAFGGIEGIKGYSPKSASTGTVAVSTEVVSTKNVSGITGYTRHGLEQAIGRDGGRGVSASSMLDAVKNPKKVISGSSPGTTQYRGKKATVVLNEKGEVVTTFGKSRGPVQQIYHSGKRFSGSGSAQRKANERGFSYWPGYIH